MENRYKGDSACLKVKGITKRFPGITANDGINLELFSGEILGLVGENGAGKTTLMRIICGMEIPDEGYLEVLGKRVNFRTPNDAIACSIGMVHQHFMLVPTFSVAVNVVLGAEPKKLWKSTLDLNRAIKITQELSEKFQLHVNPESTVGELSVADQQRVEIMKALYRGAEILILDEPTDVLTPQEVEPLFNIFKGLVADGKSVVLVTHKLHEVLSYTDRVTVLRHGKLVYTTKTENTSIGKIVRYMVGEEDFKMGNNIRNKKYFNGNMVLDVKKLRVNDYKRVYVKDVSFSLKAGEIVCIAGMEGNGQRELIEVLTGLTQVSKGEIRFNGENITNLPVDKRRKLGIIYVPEDRITTGLCLELELTMNLVFGHHRSPLVSSYSHWIDRKAEKLAIFLISEYKIEATSCKIRTRQLSGGNLQKTVLAREFSHCNIKCAIVSQPTRGLDVRSLNYVHRKLDELANQGVALLVVSSDLDEVLEISDKILVLYQGRIVAEVNKSDVDKEKLGYYMSGSHLLEGVKGLE